MIDDTLSNENQMEEEKHSEKSEVKKIPRNRQQEDKESFVVPEPKAVVSRKNQFDEEREEEEFSDADVNDLLA